jgi:hypothetical protein
MPIFTSLSLVTTNSKTSYNQNPPPFGKPQGRLRHGENQKAFLPLINAEKPRSKTSRRPHGASASKETSLEIMSLMSSDQR